MSKLTNPIELARSAALDFRACYGNDLLSVIVYGSAAGPDFDPKKSDVNLLVVISAATLPMLETSAACQERWMKKRFSRPLIMDKEYITRSLDSFPIEFLAMKDSYAVVFGEDVLKDISIRNEDLRLQIEREIKGKWLHLARGWLASRRNPARLRRLMQISLKDFSPIFKGMLHVKSLPIPKDRKSLFAAVAKAYGIDDLSLEKALEAARRGGKDEMTGAFPAYANAIKSLANSIDQLSTKGNA
ncbi:MAG TPA: hypothetical protein VKF42_01735 [Chitinivibrionales bacterium]|nr:hypothetical protein [Chitinivibrionales bacterium]